MSLSEGLTPATALRGQARRIPLVFAGTMFLSAFLLFGLQPMFTKMVLPSLGGSPAVWSVAMVFFQTLLLSGYLYAHISTRWLTPAQGLALHAALVAAAVLMLPIAVAQGFGEPPDAGQWSWLVVLFTASVGLPFFVLAATAPLLQAWFARVGHREAANPYRLYIASNLGSFCALAAYPLVVEPLLPLRLQASAWTWAFGLLAACLAGCALIAVLRAGPAQAQVVKAARTSWRARMVWTGLAAVPSGLLVAVTAHLSTDVASAPLLWVLPLALFLLTFVLAFRDRPAVSDAAMATAFARLVPFVILSLIGFVLYLTVQFVVHLGAMFIAAMVCHRALYRSRPANGQLTEFYLWMSFGGMLGGLFAGLLAPVMFDTIAEYRLLLIAALLCMPAAVGAPAPLRQAGFAMFAIGTAAAFSFLASTLSLEGGQLHYGASLALGAGYLAIIIFNRSGPVASAGAAAAAFIVLSGVSGARYDVAVRSFFGVNYVRTADSGDHRQLMHGSTVHGYHRTHGLDGKPMTGRPQPTAYYHDDGAINLALKAARRAAGGKLDAVAVLGLGVGALACQSSPGERWDFFEIDREVVKLARRAELFPFLQACTPDARIVIGDARLTLQRQTQLYDVIVLDAFSSDAVPAHLLTREAFAIYARHLAPGGVIIAHVSNRYMDLRSVAEAAGIALGMETVSAYVPVDLSDPHRRLQLATATTAVAMSRRPEAIEMLLSDRRWRRPQPDSAAHGWSDDYANILGAMLRNASNAYRQP